MAEAGKSRSQNFSSVELKQLCVSWMNISQDPIVGAGQRNLTFWDCVGTHYNQNRPRGTQQRGLCSLESKWGEVKHDVAKFAGSYAYVENLKLSGTNSEDTLTKAKELYVTKHPKKKEFGFLECWNLLKGCSRFANTMEDMASKAKGKGKSKDAAEKDNSPPSLQVLNESGNQWANSSILGADEGNNVGGEKRPIGNKSAKKLKSEECAFKVAPYAQRDMADTNAKRLKFQEEQNLQNLFTLKANDIDPDCREFFLICRSRELDKYKKQIQMEEEKEIEEASKSLRRATSRPPPAISVEECRELEQVIGREEATDAQQVILL